MTHSRDEPSADELRLLDELRAAFEQAGFHSDFGISRSDDNEDPDALLNAWRRGGPQAVRQALASAPLPWPDEVITELLAGAREHWGPPGPAADDSGAE